MTVRRRDFLAGAALLVLSTVQSRATVLSGGLPWTPERGQPSGTGQSGPLALLHIR